MYITGLLASGGGQLQLPGNNYGVIHRNDDSNYYILLTNSGSPTGVYNSYRPFVINNGNGAVSIGDGAVTARGGQVALGSIMAGGFLSGYQLSMKGNSGLNVIGLQNTGTATYSPVVFMNSAGSVIGGINCSNTGTAYNSVSDSRLKHNIAPFVDGRAILDKFEIKRFQWREDGAQGLGIIAQEGQKAYPAAFTEGRGMPGEVGFMPMGVDYSKIVPLLIEALQTAHRRIDALETKLNGG
jgi:hypothetical protein